MPGFIAASCPRKFRTRYYKCQYQNACSCLFQLMNVLANHGGPDSQIAMTSCTLMHGITAAIEAMCEPSETQQTLTAELEGVVPNRGRIICLSSMKT